MIILLYSSRTTTYMKGSNGYQWKACLEEGIFKISLSNSMVPAPILNILRILSLKAI